MVFCDFLLFWIFPSYTVMLGDLVQDDWKSFFDDEDNVKAICKTIIYKI